MDAETLRALFFQDSVSLEDLLVGHAVFRLARTAHYLCADAEVSSGIVAAADSLRYRTRDLLEKIYMSEIVKVDDRPETSRLDKILSRRRVRREHYLLAFESDSVAHHELGERRAVDPAALLLQNIEYDRVRRRLDGEILPESLVPREGGVQRARPLTYSLFIVYVERRRVDLRDLLELFLCDKRFFHTQTIPFIVHFFIFCVGYGSILNLIISHRHNAFL